MLIASIKLFYSVYVVVQCVVQVQPDKTIAVAQNRMTARVTRHNGHQSIRSRPTIFGRIDQQIDGTKGNAELSVTQESQEIHPIRG